MFGDKRFVPFFIVVSTFVTGNIINFQIVFVGIIFVLEIY